MPLASNIPFQVKRCIPAYRKSKQQVAMIFLPFLFLFLVLLFLILLTLSLTQQEQSLGEIFVICVCCHLLHLLILSILKSWKEFYFHGAVGFKYNIP